MITSNEKSSEKEKETAKTQEVAAPKIDSETKFVEVAEKSTTEEIVVKDAVQVSPVSKEEFNTQVEKFDSPESKDKIEAFVEGRVDEPVESTNFGREEENFDLLFYRDYGDEKEAHYAKEIAGAGCILRVISEYSGVKTESLVFVPGTCIIDLHEDHENPEKLTGRTIAKK